MKKKTFHKLVEDLIIECKAKRDGSGAFAVKYSDLRKCQVRTKSGRVYNCCCLDIFRAARNLEKYDVFILDKLEERHIAQDFEGYVYIELEDIESILMEKDPRIIPNCIPE